MGEGEEQERGEHWQDADDLAQEEHVELRVPQALGEFDGQDGERAGKIERGAVVIMAVGDEVEDGLIERFARREHLRHHRVLRELVRLEERDHHLVFRAGVVGEDEEGKINDADEKKDGKDTLLGQGHGAMIPSLKTGIMA